MSSNRSEGERIHLLHTGPCLEQTTHFVNGDREAETLTFEGSPEEALKKCSSADSLPETFATAVAARDVLIMVLHLPSTEPAELQGMLELQAEEISPFPPELTVMSWETLQTTDRQSKVLMALCSRKTLDRLHDLYAKVARVPSRVDIDVLGWLELLKKTEHLSNTEDCLITFLDGNQSYVIAWHQGSPCVVRSLVDARDDSPHMIWEELMMVLLSLESSFPQADIRTLQVWYNGDSPAWANESKEGWDIHLKTLDSLPPLTQGLAIRGDNPGALNLSPSDWGEEKKRLAVRKRNIRLAVSLVSGWLILMLGFLGWSLYRQSGLRSVEKLNQANAQAVADVESLSTRVRSLTQFTDRSSSALENLLTLATAAPGSGSILFENYRYDKAEGITISGTTSGDVQPFYQFLERLSAGETLRVTSYDLKDARQGFSFQTEAVWSWIQPEGEEGLQ